jgi:hypothetical protein
MDTASLRALLRPLIVALKNIETHERLSILCRNLGMPSPDFGVSKRERMEASLGAVADHDLARVALNFLQLYPPAATVRNEIQDFIWVDSSPGIPKRYRRELSRLISNNDLFINGIAFEKLLERLFVMGPADEFAALLGLRDDSLRAEVQQHVYRNSDWTVEYLFDKLGAFDCSDRRFALFLEGLAASGVRPDEPSQRTFVETINRALKPCGVEMRETDTEGGYPVFSIVSIGIVPRGRPKNLIFATPTKPDLRFKDAISNDIEIVSNPEQCLVYDEPIGSDGILWSTLQAWWKSLTEFRTTRKPSGRCFGS